MAMQGSLFLYAIKIQQQCSLYNINLIHQKKREINSLKDIETENNYNTYIIIELSKKFILLLIIDKLSNSNNKIKVNNYFLS